MQGVYSPQFQQQQQQYYQQMYGPTTSSTPMGSPYYYGYSLQSPRGVYSPQPQQRITPYLYYPPPPPPLQLPRPPLPSSSGNYSNLIHSYILKMRDIGGPHGEGEACGVSW